jgi:aspartate aminotransferase
MNLTDRIERVEPSATLAISALAGELEADGVDVVDLSVGEPDFDTPEPIVDAAETAMRDGHTGYTASKGIRPLREAIAEYLQSCNLDYGPENLIVTPGGKMALYETIQSLVQDGDEVVCLDPAWVSYEAMVKLAGGSLSRVDTTPYDCDLEPALDDLADVVSSETTMLIVNSPGNPHGSVYSDAALEGVRDLAVEHDLTVIADEIYREISYVGTPTSLASLEDMHERTITINGFSKAYSMTGWRLGYIAAPESLIDGAGKLQSHSVSCAVNFVQHAGITALEECDEYVEEMAAAFAERRDLFVDLLADAGVEVPEPEGAFYLMLPVDGDDQAWCEGAIEEAHVATVPGSAFGTPGYARISYANSKDRLREAVDRLTAEGYL